MALFAHAVRLEINDALAPNAGLILAMAKTNTAIPTDELDPGAARADATQAAAELIEYVNTLGAARGARALRVIAQARDINSVVPAAAFIKLFMTSGGSVVNPLRSVSNA